MASGMNRRQYLAALGAGAVPLAIRTGAAPRRPIEIKYWLSTQASRYSINDTIAAYVDAALAPVFDPVRVTFGGAIQVETEHGYHVTRSGEWPMRVLAGYGHAGGIDPARDINLLVTDGPLRPDPPGVARHNIASVGGASRLQQVPPPDEVPEPSVYDTGVYAIQSLLHELGHALGLDHDHGAITAMDDGTVASPMVGGYAWLSGNEHFTADRSACGESYPEDRSGTRYLSLEYSPCAVEGLREYQRSLRL